MKYGIDPPQFQEDDWNKKGWFSSVARWFESSSKTVNVTTTYTAASDIHWVRADATAGAFTVTLPLASENWKRTIGIIKTDSSSNAVTIGRTGSDTINGATTQTLATQYNRIVLKSDGSSSWDVAGANTLGANIATFLATPSSANLAAALTNESAPTANGLATFSTAWANFTPTVTLVGGAGNTVPVYSTNGGRWTQIGKTVFVRIYLTGDGGNEGAGTGQVNIALPVAVGASALGANSESFKGLAINGATFYMLTANPTASATTIAVSYWNTISTIAGLTGDAQNDTSRTVVLGGWYEVD